MIALQNVIGNDVAFACSYELGCLRYTLYYFNTKKVILISNTMISAAQIGIKMDKRDTTNIAKCQVCCTYSFVHVTAKTE